MAQIGRISTDLQQCGMNCENPYHPRHLWLKFPFSFGHKDTSFRSQPGCKMCLTGKIRYQPYNAGGARSPVTRVSSVSCRDSA